jgi:hypothetical protein
MKAFEASTIDDTVGERSFRSDDGEIDAALRSERCEAFDIVGRNRHALGRTGDAGGSGRRQRARHARIARDLPCQRMLAATGTDDEDSHGQCLKWRAPVSTMAMPCSSAAALMSASRRLPPG